MKRKDYELIAGAVLQARLELACVTSPAHIGRRLGANRVAQRIADWLEADNPRFDRHRFLVACGLED